MMEWAHWDWHTKIATGIGAASVIALFIKRVRGWVGVVIARMVHAFTIPTAFVREFGELPAEKVRKAFLDLSKSQDLSELRQQVLAKHLEFGLYICDTSGRCIEANPYLCDLFGMSREEMLGLGWLNAVVPEHRQTVYADWMWSIKVDAPYRAEYKVENQRDASSVWVKTEAFTAKKGGVIIAIAGILHEIEFPANAPVPAPAGDVHAHAPEDTKPPQTTARIREQFRRDYGNGPILSGHPSLCTQ